MGGPHTAGCHAAGRGNARGRLRAAWLIGCRLGRKGGGAGRQGKARLLHGASGQPARRTAGELAVGRDSDGQARQPRADLLAFAKGGVGDQVVLGR